MKEIKFRIIINSKIVWYEWIGSNGKWMHFYIENLVEWFTSEWSGCSWERKQFIWLKDKNGKEMYQGDILKNDNGYIYEIIWNDEILQWCIKDPTETTWTGIWDLEWYIWNKHHFLEVIWNIHENPDLLANQS